MSDKRRSFRLTVELPASFKAYPEQTHTCLGMVNEMSALGFSFTTKEFLSPGQEFFIKLRLPDDQRLDLPVKVVWARQASFVDTPEYFAGVKLLEPLTPETAQYIRFYVRYFLAEFLHKKSQPL